MTTGAYPHLRLQEVLLAAYRPCRSFAGPCTEMRWEPEAGHVPCAYLQCELDLLPNAVVVARRAKARDRLNGLVREVVPVAAARVLRCSDPSVGPAL